MSKLARSVFWTAVAFTLVMALHPKPPYAQLNASDKVVHFLAFAGLTALALVAYRTRNAGIIAIGLFAMGALIEVMQAIPALNRSPSVLDAAADGAGVVTVLVICFLTSKVLKLGD